MKITTKTLQELIREIRYQQQRLNRVIAFKGGKDGVIDSCKRMLILYRLLTALAKGEPIVVENEGEVKET